MGCAGTGDCIMNKIINRDLESNIAEPIFTESEIINELDAFIERAWDGKMPNEGRSIRYDPSLGRTFEAIKHDILLLQSKANHPAIRVDLCEHMVNPYKLDEKVDRPMKYQHTTQIPRIQLITGARYDFRFHNELWTLEAVDLYADVISLRRYIGDNKFTTWNMTYDEFDRNFRLIPLGRE